MLCSEIEGLFLLNSVTEPQMTLHMLGSFVSRLRFSTVILQDSNLKAGVCPS